MGLLYLYLYLGVTASLDYRLDNNEIEVRVPAEEIFSLLQNGQNSYAPNPTSDYYPKHVEFYVIEFKADGA
jgi:hypothetical protein